MKSIFIYDANPEVLDNNEFEYRYNKNIISLEEARKVLLLLLLLCRNNLMDMI